MPGNEVNHNRPTTLNLVPSYTNGDIQGNVDLLAQIALPEPMTIDQFYDAMNIWVNEAPAAEGASRVIAADKMKAAFSDRNITELEFDCDYDVELSELPSALGELQHIKKLSVLREHITTFPVLTRPMLGLEELRLVGCPALTILPTEFAAQIPNVRNLDLSFCFRLTVSSDQLEPLLNRHLALLNMAGCSQRDIAELRRVAPRFADFIHPDGFSVHNLPNVDKPWEDDKYVYPPSPDQSPSVLNLSNVDEARQDNEYVYPPSPDQPSSVLNLDRSVSLPNLARSLSLPSVDRYLSMPSLDRRTSSGSVDRSLHFASTDEQSSSSSLISLAVPLLNPMRLSIESINEDTIFSLDPSPSLLIVVARCYEEANLEFDSIIQAQWERLISEREGDPIRTNQLKIFGDYINKVLEEWVPRAIPAEHVTDVLAIAAQDDVLLKQLCDIAREGINNCEDNRVITFNNMQVQAQCAVIMADDTLIDKEHALLSLLKGVFRQQMLGGFTEQIMRQRWHVLGEKISAQGVPLDDEDKKTAPHLKEALEVELALRYKLGESLALPFPIKHMKHLELAEYYMVQSRYGNDLITDEEKIYVIAVIEDKAHAFVLQQENDASLVATSLINQPVWKAYLAQRYAINFARLAYTFSTRKDALVNPYTQSDEDLADEFSVEEKEKFDAAMMTYAHALKVLEDEEEQDQFAFSVKATHALLMKHA